MSFVVLHDGPRNRRSAPSFADTLRNTYGATALWKTTDMVDTTIIESVNSANNGVAPAGWTIQNTPIPITGETGLAPSAAGVAGEVAPLGGIDPSAFNSIFNPLASSFMIFAKLSATAWSNATAPYLFSFSTAASLAGSASYFLIRRIAASPGILYFNSKLNGTQYHPDVSALVTGSTTNWFMATLTYSQANAFIRSYFNGTAGTPAATATNWAGTINRAYIASSPFNVTSTGAFTGQIAYLTYFPRELSAAEVAAIYAASGI